jgi:3-dehydroquinate dehydratase/shikimate dehydrogenase
MEPKQPRICVSICERTVDDIRLAVMRAAESADLIELRLDCLDESLGIESLREIKALFPGIPVPVIVTYRPAEQGGQRDLSAKLRLLFWLFNRPAADFFDVEFDIATAPSVFDSDKHFDWGRVISSYHNFRGVPDDLVAMLARGVKSQHEMIAIAMGTPGLATRILGPSRGAFLTYASPDNEKTTAPGQVSAQELRELYRIEKINRQTQITGLIGLPVAHSVSPAMHNAAFEAAGVDAVYIPFELKDLKGFIERMVHPRTRELDWNMRGLSVTAPHKSAVVDYLDWIDPAAQEIGAVNTIVVDGNELRGYNTDAAGFIAPLLERRGDLNGASCAVIGTGGAARTAVWSLRQSGAEVTVFGRNAGTAATLAERFGVAWERLDGATFKSFNIVINATPLGTAGPLETETAATAIQMSGASFVYDLVYNPTQTRFLREAESAGCETLGGLEMLVAQAEEQFRLWTGVSAPECVMRDAASRAVDSSGSEYN